ncbi:LppA family lipoprotein [Mycobacterium sp.]|uniref:LppA family lipoprotein n=1 Tax=Mycobacterium sp. TaxID=1785 RepID=UPI0012722841|nr:LppA family lipoprotein [Mycobacterium sp.]KAA8939265.1 MAG: hypothetical protein F6Q13_19005 [Mycobacterium sp.]
MRPPTVWVLALGFVVAVGCHATQRQHGEEERVSPEKVAALENGLRSKPPLEAAQAQYRAAVTTMADAIAALVPGLTWRLETDSWNHCGGEYTGTNAKMAYLMAGFSGPIPNDTWPQAVQIVQDGAKQFGATSIGVLKDKPGEHDVSVSGPGGVEFKLGTQVSSSLTAQSDCRISQTDAPAPQP